jgi:hypothetical protein
MDFRLMIIDLERARYGRHGARSSLDGLRRDATDAMGRRLGCACPSVALATVGNEIKPPGEVERSLLTRASLRFGFGSAGLGN